MQSERRKFVQTFIDPIVSNHFEGGADYSTSKEFEQKLNKLVDEYYRPLNKVDADVCANCGETKPAQR